MTISLVIPAYNEEKYIGPCLDSVIKNGKNIFEIIVINNASTDGTAEIAGSFAGVRVVNETKKGLTFARQAGLVEAHGDIIAFVDADTRMPAGWVEKVLKAYSQRDIVCVSGPYVYDDSNIFSSFGVWIYWRLFAWPSYLITGYMAVGGNFAALKSALVTVGGFDSSIGFYGEDTDIARRLSKFGKVLFLQKLYIYTSSRRFKSEGIFTTAYRYVTNFLSVVYSGKPLTNEYNDIR